MSLLSVQDLRVDLDTGRGRWPVLDGVSLRLQAGETLGLVGESGCGKSVTALAVLRLLPQPTLRIASGRILFEDRDLLALGSDELRALRGNHIAMIFQDPMTALNPVQTVGRQIEEVLLLHRPGWSSAQRRERVLELLTKVGMPVPAERLSSYPHQLSGGMRQRVTIAMALACEPALLIADEPTTALDVTVQAQVLGLLKELQRQSGLAVLFITHDLGVVAQTCRSVAVMYAGRIVEEGSVAQLFERPSHPYTRALLASLPARGVQPQTPLAAIAGQVPPADQRGAGCRFASRCAYRTEQCSAEPELLPVTNGPGTTDSGHRSACWYRESLSHV